MKMSMIAVHKSCMHLQKCQINASKLSSYKGCAVGYSAGFIMSTLFHSLTGWGYSPNNGQPERSLSHCGYIT